MSGSQNCAVCFNGLTESGREPKLLLTCAHTFCNVCVEDLVARHVLECPSCRRPFTESQVTTNYTLRDVLVGIAASTLPASGTGEQHCSSESPQSQPYVKEWICSSCTLRNDDSTDVCAICDALRPEVCLCPGDTVTLQGLSSSTYNGQTGVLTHYVYDSKRWQVKLDAIHEPKRVKPENIVPICSLDALAQDHPRASLSQQRRNVATPQASQARAKAPSGPAASAHPPQEAPFSMNERVVVTQELGLVDGTEIVKGQAGRVVSVRSGEAWIDFDRMLTFKWVHLDALRKEELAEDGTDPGEAPAPTGDDAIFGAHRGRLIERCPNCFRLQRSDLCQCNSSVGEDAVSKASDEEYEDQHHLRSRSHYHRRDRESYDSRNGAPSSDRQRPSRRDHARGDRSRSRNRRRQGRSSRQGDSSRGGNLRWGRRSEVNERWRIRSRSGSRHGSRSRRSR